jgi:hypothetical protein
MISPLALLLPILLSISPFLIPYILPSPPISSILCGAFKNGKERERGNRERKGVRK